MNYRFRTKDCPGAIGQPERKEGDLIYTFDAMTDEGAHLEVLMGKAARDNFVIMLGWEQMDDRRENEVLRALLERVVVAGSGGITKLRDTVWEVERQFRRLTGGKS